MGNTRVSNEVGASPGMCGEELVRKEIALQRVAALTREDDVAGVVGTAVRERVYVIERGRLELERRGAIDAAPSAVAHGRALDGPLVPRSAKLADAGAASAAG